MCWLTVETAAVGDTITVKGGTAVTVTETGANYASAATANITVGSTTAIDQPTGAVVVNATTGTANTDGIGQITITGGTTVTVNEYAGNAAAGGNNVFLGNVYVTGSALTTAVTVNQAARATGTTPVVGVAGVIGVGSVTGAAGTDARATVLSVADVVAVAGVVGVTAGLVNIDDKSFATATTSSNTITSVTLNNYDDAVLRTNALTSLTLGGVGGTVAITNAATTAATNTTLNLTLNGTKTDGLTGSNLGITNWFPRTGGANTTGTTTIDPGIGAIGNNTITDTNNEITTVNVTVNSDSYLYGIADTALTTLNVSGAGVLTLGSVIPSITTIAVSGAAGLQTAGHHAGQGLSARAGLLTLTTTSSGTITATLDATTQTFVGSTVLVQRELENSIV